MMPPGTVETEGYVVQVSVDGKPFWGSLKATPDEDTSMHDAVVGDRDRVKFEIPDGSHLIEVDLLAGTSDRFLGRIRYPEPVSKEDPEEDEQ